VSSENSKPPKARPAADDGPAEAPKTTGRVKFDDRGNAVWEWQVQTGAFSQDVSTQRIQKLEHPALSLADDAPTPFETVRSNPLGTKKGYDPYDSGKLGKTNAAPRKKDLRKLGESIKLKKQFSDNKNEDGGEDA
jgi:hypothetical protein